MEELGEPELQRIKDFLQGSVRCWCKNRKGQWFALRDLVGGYNFDWSNTPSFHLYQRHEDNGLSSDEAISQAAIDSGWILKTVLHEES